MARKLTWASDIRLTLNVYSHINQQEQVAAIEVLPGWDEGFIIKVPDGKLNIQKVP